MKVKSVLILLAFCFVAFAVNSFAQGMNPEERMKRTLDEYKTKLKLTDAQFAKVDTILKNQMSEMMKIRDEAGGDFQAMREKMTPLREKTDKQVEALLTDEQKVEFKKILDERAERMKNMMRN